MRLAGFVSGIFTIQAPQKPDPDGVPFGSGFGFDIFHQVAGLAVEDFAEHFDGVGADAFVALEPRDLAGADMVVFDQGILGDALRLHHGPEFGVGNHEIQASLST